MYVILIKKTSRNSSAYITGKAVGPSRKDVRQKLRISDPPPLCLRFWRWKSCENKGRDIYTGHYLPSAFLRGMKNWSEDLRGMKKLNIKGMKNHQHTFFNFPPIFTMIGNSRQNPIDWRYSPRFPIFYWSDLRILVYDLCMSQHVLFTII